VSRAAFEVVSSANTAHAEDLFGANNGGGGNCTRSSFSATHCPNCGYEMGPEVWPEDGREDETLQELVASWHRLTPSVKDAVMELVRRG
jgi:hypothetical protein